MTKNDRAMSLLVFERITRGTGRFARNLPLLLPILLILSFVTLKAQTQTFTKDDLEYIVELPSPAWQAVQRLDVHNHVEFIYGDDYTNGYLRLRKKLLAAGTTPTDVFLNDEKWELQSLPGYIVCSDCKGEEFKGHLRGAAFSYEYVSAGRSMAGRIYYLQLDNRTFYVLHFTVTREKLQSLRGQMDFIARSFRLK